MVLGEDVSLDAVASLLETTLIGKFMFHSISKGEFNLWVKKKMGFFLGYVLIWHLMLKGWICLEFKSTFDLQTILAQPCFFGYSNLVLKDGTQGLTPVQNHSPSNTIGYYSLDFP